MQEVTNDYKDINKRLEELTNKLDLLNQTSMAMLVQLSRLYDVIAAMAFAADDSISGLLDMHEAGDIFTTAPVLRSFGEPEDSPLKEESEGSQGESEDDEETSE